MQEHWLWLAGRKGIGTQGCASLLKQFGSAERIYELTEEECRAAEGMTPARIKTLMDKNLEPARRIWRSCKERNIRILTIHDPAYPKRLKQIYDPPMLLYYRGSLPDFDREATIGVVGTRRASNHGLLQARQFSRLIAGSGGIVVSGGARGVDTIALSAALDSAMPVVCVVGCGLDIDYPVENASLFREIEWHGCMISEYPPGTKAIKGHFPARNRIISGLALGILVVEAPEGSGSLITAKLALDQGRDVFAIPGNLDNHNATGSNRLLREGAELVTDGWQIMEAYRPLFPQKIVDGRTGQAQERLCKLRCGMSLPVYAPVIFQPGERRSRDIKKHSYEGIDKKSIDNPETKGYSLPQEANLSSDEIQLLQAFPTDAVHTDVLVARLGWQAQKITAMLTVLQIKQCVEPLGGSYYKRK